VAQTVRVEGLRELEKKLKSLADEIGGKKAAQPVRAALRKAGRVVQKDAQRIVSYDPNPDGIHVKDNIIVVNTRKRDEPSPNSISVRVTVRSRAKQFVNNAKNRREGRTGAAYKNKGKMNYASSLEFGNSRQRPFPYMRPAFERNKGSLPNIIRDELALAIQKAVSKLKG
jgi:HK97 gp10 family phage protein